LSKYPCGRTSAFVYSFVELGPRKDEMINITDDVAFLVSEARVENNNEIKRIKITQPFGSARVD
jgi:hypothetical protein